MSAKLIEDEILRRETLRRFEELEAEAQKLSDELKSVEAKNIELSRQRTAAESEVKALKKQISEAKTETDKTIAELRDQLQKTSDLKAAAEKNLKNVMESKDRLLNKLERDAKTAQGEARALKKENSTVVVELTKAQKEAAVARAEKPVADRFTMTKSPNGEVQVKVHYEPESEVITAPDYRIE